MSREYQIIEKIKESERVSVFLAAAEGIEGPVIVKTIKNADTSVYHTLMECNNEHIPHIFDIIEENRDDHEITNTHSERTSESTPYRQNITVIEEYVDGETLAVHMSKVRNSDAELLGYMLQLCDAISCIHSLIPPLIHRDIKPSNIIINKDGVVKLIDFDASRRYKDHQRKTGDTMLLGTAGYAAPEQFGFSQTNEQSDIYSFGVLLADLFGIRVTDSDRPDADSNDSAFRQSHRNQKEIESIIGKCTRFDPKQRYGSIAEVRKDLQKAMRGKTSRTRAFIASVAVLAVILPAVFIIKGALNRISANTESVPADNLMSGNPAPSVTAVSKDTGYDDPTPPPSETPSDLPRSEFMKITFTGGESPDDVRWTYRGYTTVSDLLREGQEAPEYLTDDYVKTLATIEHVLLNNFRFVIHYYPLLGPKNDLCYRNAYVDRTDTVVTGITLTDMMSERDLILTDSDWYVEDNIIFIRRNTLISLPEGIYEIKTDMNTSDGRVLDLLTLNINAVETDPTRVLICPFDCLCITPGTADGTSFPVPHNIDKRIASLKHTIDGSAVDESHYRISADGRVLTIFAEDFENVRGEDVFYYEVIYDDGETQTVTVYIG